MFPLNELENGRTFYGKLIYSIYQGSGYRKKFKEQITHVKELSKHMDIEKTVNGLT